MVRLNEENAIDPAEAITETPHGYEFDLQPNVPATDLAVLFDVTRPRRFPVLLDTDGDHFADHQLTSELTPVDRDGNGVLERGVDGALIRVVEAVAIQPGMQVSCCEALRRRAAERVYGMVSGAERSYAVSLLDPRGIR